MNKEEQNKSVDAKELTEKELKDVAGGKPQEIMLHMVQKVLPMLVPFCPGTTFASRH